MQLGDVSFDEEYINSSGTTITIYKMGRLMVFTGSMRFTGKTFSNAVLVRDLPASCWAVRFGLTAYTKDVSQIFGILSGNSINMTGSPTNGQEYRFNFTTFSS